MEATDDPVEKLRGEIEALRKLIDDALDNGANDVTLRTYARLLRDHKATLVQLEKAEINRQMFRLR